MAKPYKRKGSRFWWISPVINGVQAHQSSSETDYSKALAKLNELEGKASTGALFSWKTDRGSFGELLDDVITDYKVKKRRSLYDVQLRIKKHVRPALGDMKISHVSSAVINEFILSRQSANPSAATINRDLAIIKRAFKLGMLSGKASRVPKIEMLPEDNERDAFFSPAQFQAVLAHCHPLAQSILSFAYITGWRFKSILKLEWRQVDDNFVWLGARDTKNRKAVRWPLKAGLREILEERRQLTTALERKLGRIIPLVFHRNGQPVRSLRTSWQKARIAAGVPGHRIHDFRGTATVNLLEAGVDIPKIMGMVGYKTVQMVERYARRRGARDDSLLEAGDKLEIRLGIAVRPKNTTVG